MRARLAVSMALGALLAACGSPSVEILGPAGGTLPSPFRSETTGRLTLLAERGAGAPAGAEVRWEVLEAPDATLVGDVEGSGETAELAVGVAGAYTVRASLRKDGGRELASDDATFEVGAGVVFIDGEGDNSFSGGSHQACDLDGDGRLELAVATSYVEAGGVESAGRVDLYRFDAAGAFEHVGRVHSPDPQPGAVFGWAMTCGDLSGDGIDDLVAGEHLAETASVLRAGRVHVFLGRAGLPTEADLTLVAPNPREQSDLFGVRVALGDFDGDGQLDLASTLINSYVDGVLGAGAVVLFRGGPGLSGTAWRVIENPDPSRTASFGVGMTAGDFDGDGVDDLVVGSPGHPTGALADAGAAFLWFGGDPDGWAEPHLRFEAPTPEAGARFGSTPAVVGDLDGDGLSEIALSATWQTAGIIAEAGAVHLFRGRAANAGATVTVTSDAVLENPEPEGSAQFGRPFGVGDVDGDGRADLVVTAEWASVGGLDLAGRVDVYLGREGGLPAERWRAVTAPTPVADMRFGSSVSATGDLDGDGDREVVVGVMNRTTGDWVQNGAAAVFY